MILESGKTVQFIFLLIMIGVTYFAIRQSMGGKKITVRQMPGIDAISEAIGRSTELGRPLNMTLRGRLDSSSGGPNAMVAYNVLDYIARLAARHDLTLRVETDRGAHIPLITASMEEAFILEGRADKIAEIPQCIHFLSQSTLPFAAGTIKLLEEHRPGANFIMGYVEGDALIVAESGANIGAMQVAGTGILGQVPFLAIICDYTLIGEEYFAAGAYLSQNKYQLGVLHGQDYQKMIILVFYILAYVSVTVGSNWLATLFAA